MRIMLDTNVLISMLLFPSERFRKMMEHITEKHRLVLSSFVLDEVMEVTRRKFPAKKGCVDQFLAKLSFEMVYTPMKMKAGLFEIRDMKDYPVLYTAVIEDVDILVTGDKDFLSVAIEKPEILTPAMYVEKFRLDKR